MKENNNKIITDKGKSKYENSKEGNKNLGKNLFNENEKQIIQMLSNKTIEDICNEILDKKYGDGIDRKLKLGIMYNIVQNNVNYYLNYAKRYEFNAKHIEILANRVIEGEFDSNMKRKRNLEQLGVDFRRVQNRVNEILGCMKRYNLNILYIDDYIKKLYAKEITDDKVKKDVGILLYNYIKNKVNELNDDNTRNIITKECIDILAENTILLEFSEDEERKKKLGELYPFVQNRVNEKLGKNERFDTSKKPNYLFLD